MVALAEVSMGLPENMGIVNQDNPMLARGAQGEYQVRVSILCFR